MKVQLKVTRLARSDGRGAEPIPATSPRRAPTTRRLFKGCGGVGGRLATHLKALDALDDAVSGYVWGDSDRGDRFETTLPSNVRIALADSEIYRFGIEDARTELQNYPQLARRYRRLLRGIPVALTYGRGAGQWRPVGMLDYELDIATTHAALLRALDAFYPTPLGKRMTIQRVLAERQAEAQREQPLLVVTLSSAVGGLGSATFIYDAYYTRHLLEKRGATNVDIWGVLVGPNAFRGRGPNIMHNCVATLRELELVYREGFRHAFLNGEVVSYARPPFDMLFQVDLVELPEGEDPGGKLSDAAMDAFFRQVALGIHLLTSAPMRDRLQSLLANARGEDKAEDGRLGLLSSFNAALTAVNLDALAEALTLCQARAAIQALGARCGEA